MGFVFIIRHGPVIHIKKNKKEQELLDKKKFNKILKPIVKYIQKYGKVNEIYTSPLERCYSTGKKLMNKLNIDSIYKHDGLLRKVDAKGSNKAYKFGKKFRNSNKNIIIISHSSVLRKIIEGVSGNKYKKTKFCKASLTVYDTEKKKIVEFNKCW